VKVLVSACLLGHMVRYDGGTCTVDSQILGHWAEQGLVIPFCPEVAGGLPVPRPPAEIRGAGGPAVLDGTGQVVTQAGADISEAFLQGARRALTAAHASGARLAILKESSPSCGCHRIHDGRFAGVRIPGQGVTAALLQQHGIAVFSEEELERAAGFLAQIEQGE
jgi:uncharacterized protein YbbK (DUF523 family)